MTLHSAAGLLRHRPRLTVSQLTLLATLWILLSMNGSFWQALWQASGGWDSPSPAFMLSLPVLVTSWLFLLLSLLTWGRAARPLLAVLLLISAAASYFMHSYGVMIDAAMLTNVIQTDPAETLELLNLRLFAWLIGLGLLPALLLTRVDIVRRGWKRELTGKLLAVLLSLAGVLGSGGLFYQSYASLLRNNHSLRLQLVPANVLGAAHSYLKQQFQQPARLELVGTDAHQLPAAGPRHRVLLLVVGETARAADFSLNGYGRDTNPELARLPVINFPQASSCGTATAVSVPCMFLDVGRSGYRDSMAGHREGLLDVLQRAGVDVLWRDNNSGCKGVCDRVPNESVDNLQLPEVCEHGECHDEALLSGLQQRLQQLDRDAVIVLHMKGSHGPAYYQRYPQAFEHFTPVCKSNELDRCDRASIRNAYDNSLLYTDHVVASAIGLLQQNRQLDSALLYLSDHGESLGENGVYLHGLPYSIAPDEQTHIPMLMWLSDNLQQDSGISRSCLQQQASQPVSQDNLFHSALGLMGVQTSAYRSERDLFQPCAARQQLQATATLH